MHDVTKRGLALAVATGGLLITGAAPAVSAVSPHPEHPDHAGTKSRPTGGSSHRTAAIPVNEPQVKQYAGRHKAPEKAAGRTAEEHAGRHAATPRPTAVAHHPATPHPSAARHAAAAHSASTAHHPSTAPHHASTAHHPGTAHHPSSAPHHPSSAHHPGTAPHHDAPHAGDCPPAAGTCAPPSAPAPTPAWVTSVFGHHQAHPGHHDHHPGAEAAASAQGSDLGGGGLLAGNTVEVPIDAPVNVCGVLVTVLDGGDQAAGERCVNGPDVAGGPNSSASAVTAGAPGTLSNNVVQVPVSLPANICGDTVTAVGGHDSAEHILCANEGRPTSSTAQAVAANSPGLVSGNVVQVPVDAPLNVCGVTANVVAVYDTAAGNRCVNGGDHTLWTPRTPRTPGQSAAAGADAVTANSTGAVTGNVVQVPIAAPVDVCGDSIDVVGAFNSARDNRCVNHTAGGAAAHGTAVGNNGVASGNVAQLPIDIPTEVCGVVAAVGAYHATAVGNTCENTGAPTSVASATTAGETGIVTGNVLQGSLNAPVHICGTTVGAGIVNSWSEGTDCGTGQACACASPAPTYQQLLPEHLHRHHRRPNHEQLSATEEIRQLPHTGTDVLDYAALGAGALVLGAGAVMAGRRKSRSAN